LEGKLHKFNRRKRKMSEILKRTIFIDDSDGYVRFHDWAVVITEMGAMFEPFQHAGVKHSGGCKQGLQNYNAKDAMCRIDRIERLPMGMGYRLIAGDGIVTGGTQMPRSGR